MKNMISKISQIVDFAEINYMNRRHLATHGPIHKDQYVAEILVEEGVIAPPLKIKDKVFALHIESDTMRYWEIDEITYIGNGHFKFRAVIDDEDCDEVDYINFDLRDIDKTVYVSKSIIETLESKADEKTS